MAPVNSNYSKPKKITKGSIGKNITRSLVMSAVFTSCYAVTAFAQQGLVNSNNVNLRTAANPDSSVYGVINAGDEV